MVLSLKHAAVSPDLVMTPKGVILLGDNVERLAELPPASCTAMVTDPPGGIPTLGLSFEDSFGPAYCRSLRRTFKAAKRVLQPGALAVVWSYPNTFGWAQLALLTAGYEIVHVIPWINAEGRPKSKGLPAPGCEFWIVARTPGPPRPMFLGRWREAMYDGREPRGLVLGLGVGPALDRLVGRRRSGAFSGKRSANDGRHIYGRLGATEAGKGREASDGGPSRFFVDHERLLATYAPRCRHAHRQLYPGGPVTQVPTPKSVDAMVPLVDLACGIEGLDAERGRPLDPWCGSGSTGAAALLLGHDFIGIDKDPQAVEDARVRMNFLHRNSRV